MSYKVKLNVFEGPFDLLVYLIEHARMSIYDIEISQITAQYMEAVSDMKKADMNVASEFMALAAALLEIKSKMLLPRPAARNEGETIEDPRQSLWKSCWNTRGSRQLPKYSVKKKRKPPCIFRSLRRT